MSSQAISRRGFLKLAGLGLVSVPLSCSGVGKWPVAPTDDPLSNDSTPDGLQMDDEGIIYGGPFLQSPAYLLGSGWAIYRNLTLIMPDCGFQCGLNGWTPYYGLQDPTWQIDRDGKYLFHGRLPDTDAWLYQEIYTDGSVVHFDLELTGLDPDTIAAIEYAEVNFHLRLGSFQGHTFVIGATSGTYPAEPPPGYLVAENFAQIELCADDPTLDYHVEASVEMSLWDGREYDLYEYSLTIPIPLENPHVQFTLSPPPSDPGPSPAAARYSHVGYLPGGEKLAVLEIDWRDAWPDLSARLERKTAGETVLEGQFEPAAAGTSAGMWKQFAAFDFSAITQPGEYRVAWSGGHTDWFRIGPDIFGGRWHNTLDAFVPYQMCHLAVDLGDGVRAHDACHLDDAIQAQPNTPGPDEFTSYESSGTPVQPGETLPAPTGGWHDAADYDLNVPIQAFVTHLLALAYEEFAPARDVNALDVANRRMHIGQPNGVPDLLEQVEWGVRWLLSMQQADGRVYVGVVGQEGQWGVGELPEDASDGQPDTGDEREMYVDYHSADQLKFIVATAAASRVLQNYDIALVGQCWGAAKLAWNYFRSHDEAWLPQVYFHPWWFEGREQMITAAAAELYLTDPDPSYLNAIAEFEDYLRELPVEGWEPPKWTQGAEYWYATPYLARLWPHLPEGSLREAVESGLGRAADALRADCARRPFPVNTEYVVGFGNNDQLLPRVFDAYWLSQAVPERISLEDALPSIYWLFGLHPFNDLTFVLGAGYPEPAYLTSIILQARLGDQPATVPGAIVPGMSRYGRIHALSYLDEPNRYIHAEAGIYDTALFIFDMLALEQMGLQRLYLPVVGNSC